MIIAILVISAQAQRGEVTHIMFHTSKLLELARYGKNLNGH